MSHTSNNMSNVVNENDSECTRKSSRIRTMTEKGRSYHELMVQKAEKEQSRKLANALSVGKSQSCIDEPAHNTAKSDVSKHDSVCFGGDSNSLPEKADQKSYEQTLL